MFKTYFKGQKEIAMLYYTITRQWICSLLHNVIMFEEGERERFCKKLMFVKSRHWDTEFESIIYLLCSRKIN